LHDLTRRRRTLIEQRAHEVNRIHKLLEAANIKLGLVVSDLLGASGRAMLRALQAGERDGVTLAALAKGTLRQKRERLAVALTGRFTEPPCVPARGGAGPHRVPGVRDRAPERADRGRAGALRRPGRTGADDSQRQPPGSRDARGGDRRRHGAVPHGGAPRLLGRHLSWQSESAGKRHSGRTRHGNPWLRGALVEVAQAAGRTKNCYLAAQYQRLAAPLGRKKAALAVGHPILVIAYHLLHDQTDYPDLGAQYFEQRSAQATERRLVRRLEALGYRVTLEPTAS
jgi:transposase